MLKLVDKPDLGSGAERRMGSIPFARTQKRENHQVLSSFKYLSYRHEVIGVPVIPEVYREVAFRVLDAFEVAVYCL